MIVLEISDWLDGVKFTRVSDIRQCACALCRFDRDDNMIVMCHHNGQPLQRVVTNHNVLASFKSTRIF